MTYQRGSIRKSKTGEHWILRYRVTAADGRRVEHNATICLVRDFPKERDAWREVDRQGILVSVNAEKQVGRIHFNSLAEFYLKADFGPDAARPKSATTTPIVQHYVRAYLIPRWGELFAADLKPIEIQRWFAHLHKERGLANTTVAKIRTIFQRIYKIGLRNEMVDTNPVAHTECRTKTAYKAIIVTPAQTLAILNLLAGNPLHFALVLTCAATALRSSEILALRWSDILWTQGKISVSKRWAKGSDGDNKTAASNSTVPLHPVLAEYLKEWHVQTLYPKHGDFVFPSLAKFGKVPLWASTFVQDHLRGAAIKAGVNIAPGQRFGLHNLRHSLSTWLVNQGKVAPKTVQGILRHANVKTTLGLYTQDDSDEMQAAQGAFLSAIGLGSRLVQ